MDKIIKLVYSNSFMNKESTQEALVKHAPEIILAGSVLAGLAGFADSMAHIYFHTSLGIRNALPEPFDLPDHGMSMFAGAALAYEHSVRHWHRKAANGIDAVTSPDTTNNERRIGLGRLRRLSVGIAAGAIITGSFYVVVGEVGSEALHYINDRKQEHLPPAKRKPLPLGHFDPLDVAFGVGAAVGVAKTRQRNIDRWIDDQEVKLPPTFRQKPISKAPIIRQNNGGSRRGRGYGRYTPPKKKR